jgi:hypothetical protein
MPESLVYTMLYMTATLCITIDTKIVTSRRAVLQKSGNKTTSDQGSHRPLSKAPSMGGGLLVREGTGTPVVLSVRDQVQA